MSQTRTFRLSRLWNTVLKLAVTLILFWLVLRGVDRESLFSMLRSQDGSLLLGAAVLIAVQIILGALRWQLILKALAASGERVMSRLAALKLYYISVFFNCCLPGTVGGDVVRVWLTKSDHVPLPLAINSVIIDRVIALLALGLLVLATLPFFLGNALGLDMTLVVSLLIVAAILGIKGLGYAERMFASLKHLRPVHWLLYFIQCLRLMLKHPKVSILSLLYALAAHVSFCLCGWVLARSLGIEISVLQCLALIPPVMLAITLPVSIGGWGVREAGMVGMLGLAGVPQTAALMLSVQLGLINILLSLPAGALWLAYRRQKAATHAP